MCAIAGLIASDSAGHTVIELMAKRLAHRGPDDEGIWTDPASGVALANRRAGDHRLSPQGHQPMVSLMFQAWLRDQRVETAVAA